MFLNLINSAAQEESGQRLENGIRTNLVQDIGQLLLQQKQSAHDCPRSQALSMKQRICRIK